MKNNHVKSVSLKWNALPTIFEMVQFDTGNVIALLVRDVVIPGGTTAKAYFQKPSGKIVYKESGITVSGQQITIPVDNQAIAEVGNTLAQVTLYNGTDTLSTFDFTIKVYASRKDWSIQNSETVISAFDAAVDAAVDAIENVAQEAEESIGALLDPTLSLPNKAAEAKATGDAINQIKEEFTNKSKKLYSLVRSNEIILSLEKLSFRNIGINENSGQLIVGEYPKYLISELLETDEITHLHMNVTGIPNVVNAQIYYYDDELALFDHIIWNYTTIPKNIPIRAQFIRIRINFSANTTPSALVGVSDFKFLYDEKNVKYTVGKNKFNPSDEDCVFGFIGNSTGALNASTTYKVSGFIPVKKDESIVISPRFRHFLAYDTRMSPISESYISNAQSNYVYTATEDGYIRFSYYANQEAMIQVEEGTVATVYEEYKLVLEGISVDNGVAYGVGNLHGKKWAPIGDSFTNGDFTGSAESYLIEDGRYTGKTKTYPYLIGNRCGMDIQHMSIGGMTLATPASIESHNCFTDTESPINYTQIAADVDYITIYLGINDSHNAPSSSGGDGEMQVGEIPLGTITDTTPTTFYGAWNFVLPYLIEHHPYAKIGIIVSNGCDSDEYRIASIEIAKRHGLPYIDLNGDERTPMMNRSTNQNVQPVIKTLRNAAFRVSVTNGHSNVKAHEYESTIIENFLLSL